MKIMIAIFLLVTLQNLASASGVNDSKNVQTIERCESIADQIMDTHDISDKEVVVLETEMENLECNEHGDFFN